MIVSMFSNRTRRLWRGRSSRRTVVFFTDEVPTPTLTPCRPIAPTVDKVKDVLMTLWELKTFYSVPLVTYGVWTQVCG